MTLMLIRYQFEKKNHLIQKVHLNTLFDSMIMRLLDHSLCVRFPQMTGYAKKLEFNLRMSFKISDKELLKEYNQIWKRIEKLLKIKLNSKPFYGDDEKYVKTKLKTYVDSGITNFCNKKIRKEKAPCKCLSIIMLDFVIKIKKKYYPQNTFGRI